MWLLSVRRLRLALLLRHWTGVDTRGEASHDVDGALNVQTEKHALECSEAHGGIFERSCVAADRVEEHAHAIPGILLCGRTLLGSGDNRQWGVLMSDSRRWRVM